VFRPRTVDAVVRDLGRAVETALTCPRGPVYLDIPTDLLSDGAPPIEIQVPPPLAPRPDDVERLLAEIAAANRIVLWAGGGAVQAGAADEVAQFAEALGASVITTYAARGILPADHPNLVGLPPHEPEVAELIANADLMIALGTGFDGMMTRNWTMPMPPRLANVNCDPGQLAVNYRPDVGVLADVRLTLQTVLKQLPVEQRPAPPDIGPAVRVRLAADPESADAMALLASIERARPSTAVVVADMAIPGYWAGGYLRVPAPRRLQYPVGWGTLGYALPASIGPASIGAPVLVVCGDGGFMFAVGELAALVEHRLPVVVLLVDDRGYGMLRYDQLRAGDPSEGVDLVRPDFVALARSCGIEAELVDDPGEPLGAALERAFAAGAPRLVVLNAELTPPRTTSPRWRDN
jgi:thiamine pyrophosphate-dependent acetolactate synthase large subunit-like protein